MLSDEQLEIISEAIQPLFQYLEKEVIVDIARRIQKTLTYTRTAELQALSMKKLGYSPARIRREVMKILNADSEYRKQVAKNTLEYKKEIRDIINEITKEAYKANNDLIANAGNMAWINDLSVWKDAGKALTDNSYLSQLVEAFSAQTADELKNITQTTGFKTMSGYESVGSAYRKELDKAVIKICSGTFSHDKVIHDVVHNLAQSGLRSIDFASGYSMQLDTAARLAVRTGCHQLAGRVMDKNIEQTGENLVYVDKHNGARNTGTGHANHEQWQGKVYYIKPGHDYKKEAERIGQKEITDLWEATGYSVDGAHENDLLGLYGYNCQHHDHPWFEGISTFPVDLPEPQPVTINGKTYDYYAMTQKMRAMERGIRALKREKEALEALGMDTTEIRAKIRRKTKEYKDFCGICDIRPKTERLRYECGTSNLRKTKAWQKADEIAIEKSTLLQSEKYGEHYDSADDGSHFVSGTNTVFEGKSMEEKVAIAVDMVREYTDREINWNGKTLLSKSMWANGRYRLDGSMEFKEKADNRTYMHEALHAASVPYISKKRRDEVRLIEEASVELLAREILNEKNIPYSYMDRENVNALIRINDIILKESIRFRAAIKRTAYTKDKLL